MRRVLLALCFVATLCGCKWGSEHRLPPPTTDRLPNSKDDYKVYNRIGFDLLYTTEPVGENQFVGPIATTTLLTVLLNGSSGAAHDQLLSVLSTSEASADEFNEGQRALLNQIDLYDKQPLAYGGGLWSVWPVMLDKQFVANAGSMNAVTVKKLGNTGIEAVRLVNEFASERTGGRIPTIVEKLDRKDQSFGTVVTSFHWTGAPFYASGTMSFDGSDVPAISANAHLYYSDARYACATIPLGDSGCNLTILVPKNKTKLTDLEDVLNESGWSLLLASMVKAEIEVVLPIMDLVGSAELQKPISENGAYSLFEDDCNLRRISIEMEKGYRLSGISEDFSVQLSPASKAGKQNSGSYPISLRAERPFFMAVSDAKTRTVLLMGFVHQPTMLNTAKP